MDMESKMLRHKKMLCRIAFACIFLVGIPHLLLADDSQFAGSKSCKDCHARFYDLWATSRHGTALQPFTESFAKNQLSPQSKAISIGDATFLYTNTNGAGAIEEKTSQGSVTYPISYALGGKYVYYFLTRMERGRLQTLPIAYDVRTKEWFDMSASGVRHLADIPVSWQDQAYTFNTSCYGCHVSQTSINYTEATDSYDTEWKEAGINCETCHGPSAEHVRVCIEAAAKGTVPKDLKILGGKGKFTVQQNTDSCAPCHAQMTPISKNFVPGESFYDHYDLTTLEDSDWYPDGRDLGENYTQTTWSLSPCVTSGELGCMHCHTSSGRFKQAENPNKACSPCHEEKIQNVAEHTMHKPDSAGSKCISCHMVKTEFARMYRSDHSMLPPTPAATIEFGSPNACNVCHTDKDAKWADSYVRKWRSRDYQAPVLHRASLIEAARENKWDRLPEMLTYINDPSSNEIFVTSLIRLLRNCPHQEKWETIAKAASHTSPLVRGAACTTLDDWHSHDAISVLAASTGDKVRLVRIRAAASLAGKPYAVAEGVLKEQISKATGEYLAALHARPDVWTTHYNLGNYYRKTKQYQKAIQAYTKSNELAPAAIAPMVNCALLHGNLGNLDEASTLLANAYTLAPENLTILYNLGLLEAEKGQYDLAEKHLKVVLQQNPEFGKAASNLAAIISYRSPSDAIEFAQKAYDIDPNPATTFSLAYYMKEAGETQSAYNLLLSSIEKWPTYSDSYLLLYELAEGTEQKQKVKMQIRKLLSTEELSPEDKERLTDVLND
ncbi:tetratricopeptide repeat protein [Halodesulfovibrio sp. MK-HDV]|jgi:tetratricopeptide (TPR) repeat protein|uniref:tetratricopeptide repeat protein n=1 Tax=Halodesulfovibrio sp. MK-HDV TaxID=2599925 RepID=UPI00136C43D0|nr:tetratricopeptide repeat protein [Halodesulfovibrio sp. MK-HDV]KAF1077847.1 Lipopolysaccharide assembly protein B [Halodesulfovibrio sp. MK-HDV]